MNKFAYLPLEERNRRTYGIKRPKRKNWKIKRNRKHEKLLHYVNNYDDSKSKLMVGSFVLLSAIALAADLIIKAI